MKAIGFAPLLLMTALAPACMNDQRPATSAETLPIDALKDQPKTRPNGVELSNTDEASVKAIEKTNKDAINAVETQEKADEKAASGRTAVDSR